MTTVCPSPCRHQPSRQVLSPRAGSGLITEINGIEAEGLDSYEWWFYTIGYDDGHRNRDNHRDGHDHRDGQAHGTAHGDEDRRPAPDLRHRHPDPNWLAGLLILGGVGLAGFLIWCLTGGFAGSRVEETDPTDV